MRPTPPKRGHHRKPLVPRRPVDDLIPTLQPGMGGQPRGVVSELTAAPHPQVELPRNAAPGQQPLGNQHLGEAQALPRGEAGCGGDQVAYPGGLVELVRGEGRRLDSIAVVLQGGGQAFEGGG